MPVPISTTSNNNNKTTTNTIPNNQFYNKYSVDDLNNIYKELLRNKNSIKQNVTAQIYFKNYIQDSLRFLREKAKEHEAKLRDQLQLSRAFNVGISFLFLIFFFLQLLLAWYATVPIAFSIREKKYILKLK